MVTEIKNNKVINNYPELIHKYWNKEKNDILNIDEDTITCYNNKKAWWKVSKTLKNGNTVEYTWISKVRRIVNGYEKNGDIICPLDVSTHMVLEGYNDFQTLYPHFAKHWSSRNTIKPTEIRPNSTKKIIFEYDYVDFYNNKKTIYYEVQLKCMTKRDKNWFPAIPLSSCPELLEQYDFEKNKNIDINTLSRGSSTNVWWKGKAEFNGVLKTYSYKQSVIKRCYGKSDPIISSQKIIKGINSFGDMYPDLLKEWDYELNTIDPFLISSGSRTKVHFICPLCGCKYSTGLYHRTNKNKNHTNCPACTISKNEMKIKEILNTYDLQKYGYTYIHQYFQDNRFGKRYYYDFCIYDKIHKKVLYLIEYDGEDHYMYIQRGVENSKKHLKNKLKERKYRDILKDIICYEQNIKLKRIPYYQQKNIEIYIDNIMKELNIEKKENFK